MTMLQTTSLRISCVLTAAILAGAAPSALAQVTAGDVVDRPSLRAFVERAHARAEALVAEATTEDEAYQLLDAEFRPMGEWHEGPIYLFALLAEGPARGTNVFSAANRALEGRNLWDNEDKNGVLYVQELIAKAGTDFVEYHFDNPDVIGDEDEGSLKVGWSEVLTVADQKLIIGSGFYPATAVPILPPQFAVLLLAFLLAAGRAQLRRRQRR